MNTIMKLAAAALGAASIAGGVAVAQDTSSKDPYAHPDTANYGTPPGAPLKRDGSLRADPTPAPLASPAAADTSSTTTTTSTTTTVTPPIDTAPTAVVADPSPAPVAAAPVDDVPAPRADRN